MAEDMKRQKIKAIKYLATIGCGCYDKDGKVTESLIAATDDCTPEVRLAAIEAIQDAAGNECCKKCGSTSCCNEVISARLSEIAYERDDDGLCLWNQVGEIRNAAAKALCVCCPGGAPRGPFELGILEEDLLDSGDLPIPVPDIEPIPGETQGDDWEVEGETNGEDSEIEFEGELQATIRAEPSMDSGGGIVRDAPLLVIGGVTVEPTNFLLASHSAKQSATGEVGDLNSDSADTLTPRPDIQRSYKTVVATVKSVNPRTGDVLLSLDATGLVNPRASATVYYIDTSPGNEASAT